MTMVNATVSHDIRNPLNSISCQNFVLKMLVERINDLLETQDIPLNIKEPLERIRSNMAESLVISCSSEKLILFLVDDFLDLGQLKAKKFR